jgi:large subunit ribosomal protein L17
MRHRKSFNHLGRKSASRKAMLSNMAASLIMHKRITTTVAKAKELRKYVEPLITKAKDDTTHSRRVVFSYLQDKFAVTELFREVSSKIADRPGGYTRIIKLGPRPGDNAEMAMIELVDYNELMLKEKGAKKAKSTRRRRGGKKKETTEATAAAATEEVAEVKEEVKAEEKVEEKVEEVKEEVVEDKKEEKAEEVKEEEKAPVEDDVKEEPEAKKEEKKEEEKKDDKKEEKGK